MDEKMREMLRNSLGMGCATIGIKAANEDTPRRVSPAEVAAAGKVYLHRHTFEPGNLVQFKPGMKTYGTIEYGEPAVVLEVVPGHRRAHEDENEAYKGEPEDMRIGVMLRGALVGFWVDSARFEPFRS